MDALILGNNQREGNLPVLPGARIDSLTSDIQGCRTRRKSGHL